MPRVCIVCTHPKRDTIEQLLLEGASLRAIGGQFNLPKSSLGRHKDDHIAQHLTRAKEAEEISSADNLTAELRRLMERVNLLYDACDRWLRDPDNPDQYEIGPRSHEVKVVYEELIEVRGEKRAIKKKEKLSALLQKIEGKLDITVISTEYKNADPRHLLLNASGRLASQLELLAKLLGELQENHTVNILISPQWMQIRSILVSALIPYPDARFAVADALEKIGYVNGHS